MKLEIRLHGRGGQGIKTAGRVVGTSAFYEGYDVQDSPMYGPERRGAHVTSFVRISDEKVDGRGYIFNPDSVIVGDPSLLSLTPSPLQGLKKGGVLIVNSPAFTSPDPRYTTVAYDVTAEASKLLGMRSAISAGLGALACKVLGVARWESVERAVVDEMEELGLRAELVELNVKLAEVCYRNPPTVEVMTKTAEGNGTVLGVVSIPYIPPAESTAMVLEGGNSRFKKTGSWRLATPVIDYSKCTRCMVCYVYCPDACITVDEKLTPFIDHDNCKGCLICYVECPIKAIKLEEVVA